MISITFKDNFLRVLQLQAMFLYWHRRLDCVECEAVNQIYTMVINCYYNCHVELDIEEKRYCQLSLD